MHVFSKEGNIRLSVKDDKIIDAEAWQKRQTEEYSVVVVSGINGGK